MRAVVSRVEMNEPLPEIEIEADLVERARSIPGFESIHIVQLDGALALLVVADSDETLNRIGDEVGSPWMSEHVNPRAKGAPDRQLGDVVVAI